MPKAPVLEVPAWEEVFDSAKTFSAWLQKDFDKPEHLDQITEFVEHGVVEGGVEARIGAVPRRVNVLVFAECWCPDVVRHLPIVERLARINDRIRVRYLYLSDRPDLFSRYLTTGGEAVPKMVFFNQTWVECGSWGPLPAAGRQLIARGRACGNLKQAREQVAALYQADPKRRIAIEEILAEIEVAAAESP